MARTWPGDPFDFCWMPDIGLKLDDLAADAEKEDWENHATPSQNKR
jgi:hypothetical protein